MYISREMYTRLARPPRSWNPPRVLPGGSPPATPAAHLATGGRLDEVLRNAGGLRDAGGGCQRGWVGATRAACAMRVGLLNGALLKAGGS